MSNTQKKILNTARILFNELGYSQVTIRMIALKLNMSSGNLNYHFRKREDILEALYFEMVDAFDNRVQNFGKHPVSLKHIKSEIQSSMERMVAYKFFWTDLYHLLQLRDTINLHFEKVHKERLNGYKLLFELLKKDLLLKEASFKNEYSFLMQRMIDFSNTWLYASSLYGKNKITEKYTDRQASILMAMLYPYLTNLGKRQFQQLNPDYFL